MLKTIVQKEMLENLFGYKFSIVTVLSIMLIFVSISVMYQDYLLRVENYQILQPKSNEDIAIIRPTPLSIFAKGLDENLCRSYEINLHGGQIKVGSKQQSVNNLFRLFTTPDLLYIIKVILSLCVMLFAFDIICGEKETGTLRQVVSNTMERPILIIGKWLGGFISFILPFFMAVLFGTLLVTLSSMVDMNGENWTKLALFLLSSVIYLAVFFSLGLLISCLTHHSSTSLVISLFVWSLLVFIIPNLGNILARQLTEIPTVQQIEVKRSQYSTREFFQAAKQTKSWNDAYEVINSENDKLIADYRNRFNRLVTLSQNITRLSPTAAFAYLATDLMGTGISEERKLKKAVLQYKDLVWNKQKGDTSSFTFQRSSIKDTLSSEGLANFAILVLFNTLFFVSTYVAFLRYDVR